MNIENHKDKKTVLIVDFGSQYTAIIARKIRALSIYCEIVSCYSFDFNQLDLNQISCFILSGGPASVHEKNSPTIDQQILTSGKPILGICYGMQLICHLLGSKVEPGTTREFGATKIKIIKESPLTKDWCELDHSINTWMSHGDCVNNLPEGFEEIAMSENNNLAIIADISKKIYGLQFHPEVAHTENGNQLLLNFLKHISGCEENWKINDLIEEKINDIKAAIPEDELVIAAVSGGVDSTVAAVLMERAIGSRLICIFIDTGLLRKNEAQQVMDLFAKHHINIKCVSAHDLFFTKLAGVSDPEEKRKIIGGLFIELFEKEAKLYNNAKFLMQGTLYTDIIESVSPNGGPSVTIKSHHNVGGLPEKMNLKLIEPLKDLFKDEVRHLGRNLNINEAFIKRHPFPGPGLAIRVDGEVTREKITILQEVDAIYLEALHEFGLYDHIWQAFAFLTELRSVGVMGDGRTYERACILRAINSHDGMTASVYPMSHEHLQIIMSRIVNKVRGINRVCYDLTSKPPATIEFQ